MCIQLNMGLGAYEQRVLLELDKLVTWEQVQYMRSIDPRLEIPLLISEDNWESSIPVHDTVLEIIAWYNLPLYGQCPVSVAVLGYN